VRRGSRRRKIPKRPASRNPPARRDTMASAYPIDRARPSRKQQRPARTYGHKYGNQNSSGQEPGEAFAAYGKPTVFVPLPQIATNSEKSVATNYTNSTKLFRVIREIRGKPFWRVNSSTGPRLKHWLSKLILGCRIYEPMYLGFAQE